MIIDHAAWLQIPVVRALVVSLRCGICHELVIDHAAVSVWAVSEGGAP